MRKADLPAVIHPDDIAGLIHIAVDKPLRTLIAMISETTWLKTFGCCAGKALHSSRHFYIITEVKASRLHTFMRWLSLAHKIGCDRHRENPKEAFAIARAELEVPNLFYDTESPTGALLGPDWLRFHITFSHMDPVTKPLTMGGIKALELALEKTIEESRVM